MIKRKWRKHWTSIHRGAIIQVNDVSKYRPATGLAERSDPEALAYVAQVRKELGVPAMGDDLKLAQEKFLGAEQTVAVLEADGKQIWGKIDGRIMIRMNLTK